MKKYILQILIILLFVSVGVSAQAPKTVAGHWEGTIDTPNGAMGINVDLALSQSGKWEGELGIPSQNLSGFPLSNLKVEGANISFEMRGAPGKPTFNGKLSEDGKTIAGDMVQGGATLPFKIERKGEAKLTASAPPIASGAGTTGPAPNIAGSWQGALDAGGTTLRIIVKISKAADGSLTAALDSPDQGNSDLPVSSITATETNIRFDLKYLGAYFEGKLNKELTEMSGDWFQGGAAMPLVLKRAK
jgi:hypothetical protein